MPINLFMTWDRILLMFMGLCVVFMVFGHGFLNDLNIDDPDKFATPPVAAKPGPAINGEFRHVHWFVQLSDLHISRFYDKARASDLKSFCADLSSYISPEVVLVTGDITDAKNLNKEGSQQFEDEWQSYSQVLHDSKILEKAVWLDVRGNHDVFNVPSLHSAENYFRVYSAQGGKNMLSYHYLHNSSDGDVISFIAIDACPIPGPKRPFNFFGILSQETINQVTEFVSASSLADHTIFFGHYPSSTISGVSVSDVRELFGHGSLYLCGHLHTLGGFVPQMYSKQKTGYLELELADWKDQRRYRLLVFDHGLLSFVDVALNTWPVVVISNPKNALFLIDKHEPTNNIRYSTHIRILAFSNASIERVTVKLDDKYYGEAQHVKGPLFVLPWDPLLFMSGLHSIEVNVVDVTGQETTVSQSFSVDGTQPYSDFLQRFILMSDMVCLVKVIFAVCYIACVLPILVLRFVRVHLHVHVQSTVGSCFFRFFQCWLRRLVTLCSTPTIFYPLLVYDIYILVGPWFIGEILDGHIGACFIFGFVLKDSVVFTTLTYCYGSLQDEGWCFITKNFVALVIEMNAGNSIMSFNVPLTLYLARCLDLAVVSSHRDRTRKMRLLVWLLDHSIFFVIIGLQIYYVLAGFYRAYGLFALLVCPLRTWAVLLAIYLRHQALKQPITASRPRSSHVADDL